MKRQSTFRQTNNSISNYNANDMASIPLSSFSLDAAALQSEMMKKYGMIGGSNFPLPKASQHQRLQKRQSKERKDPVEKQHLCPSCHHQLVPNTETNTNIEFCEFCGYFFNVHKPELSLAQKRGLVPLPTNNYDTLKPLDWYLVERTIEKKIEPDAFCPICMGPFTQREEVLLSCGHLFHKICLRSFENFVKNADLSCPICR